MLDYDVFHETIAAFAEQARTKISDGLLRLYYEALKDMDTEEFTRSATRVFKERKYTNMPTAADFLDAPGSDDQAMLAADEVLEKMRSAGGDEDVSFKDQAIMNAIRIAGGWWTLCEYVNSFDLDKLGIWKREFAAQYRSAKRLRGVVAPNVLLGRMSAQQVASGYLSLETGELKNALGVVVSVKPWGGKCLTAGDRPALVAHNNNQEVSQKNVNVKDIVGSIVKQLEPAPDGE